MDDLLNEWPLAINILINSPPRLFIVDFRINETLQIGRRCFQLRRFNLPGGESVYLFLEPTINKIVLR